MSDNVRPWGKYEVLFKAPGIQIKRIEVFPGMRFSLQNHLRRAEKWVVVSGQGTVTLDAREFQVSRGSMVDVPVGQVHRLRSAAGEPLVLIEVQLGDYLEEDDIIRLADDFNRI